MVLMTLSVDRRSYTIEFEPEMPFFLCRRVQVMLDKIRYKY